MVTFLILAIENDDDREFMAGLYIKYYPLMLKTAREAAANSDAADIVHDAVVSLIDKLTTLRALDEKRRAAYIYVTVKNTGINRSKAQQAKKRLKPVVSDALFLPAHQRVPVEDSFINRELYDRLGEAIGRLPENERLVLINRYWLGKSNDEIARLLGLSPKSIYTYISRAKKNLKLILEKRGDTANV